jgi:hypothetical protein
MSEEDSVACLRHRDWAVSRHATLYLSSLFLANRAKVNPERSSLAYSMTLGVRVPDYEVSHKLWADEHYEGGYLFRDAVVIELIPPQDDGQDWQVVYDWQSDNIGQASTPISTTALMNGKVEVSIGFDSGTTPGIRGKLRFVVSAWNSG